MGLGCVLMYHHVIPSPSSMWDVYPEQLARHVQYFLERGFQFGSLKDVMNGTDDIVVFTFDDAYTNVYENALPVLSSFGVQATVFVPINFVGGMNTFDCLFEFGLQRPERIMSWSQIGDLLNAGWSVPSHSCSHLPLSNLLPEHIEDEVRRSKHTIEDRLGTEVFAFSYPYGIVPQSDQQVDTENLLETNGYHLAVLATGGATPMPPPERYRIPRIMVTSENRDPPVDFP